MQNVFQVIDTSDWTIVILFGMCLMSAVAITDILDNKKKKDDFYFVNGRLVHNDYDSRIFRFLFAWFIFMAVCVGFVIYKYCTKA